MRPVKVKTGEEGSGWLADLYDLFAPVREEAAKFSEEEVNADIYKAVAAVRRERVSSRY